jgi:hypothetical protein
MLEYTKTPYDHVIYPSAPPPDYNNSHWYGVKEKLGYDFPNVRYLIAVPINNFHKASLFSMRRSKTYTK